VHSETENKIRKGGATKFIKRLRDRLIEIDSKNDDLLERASADAWQIRVPECVKIL
jgi:hypothetical protein